MTSSAAVAIMTLVPAAAPVSLRLSPLAASLADQGVRRVAITWVNHAGAPLVKVVPLAGFDAAVASGVGFSPVSDAFRVDGAIDSLHRLALPDGDLRLRADPSALALLEPVHGWAWVPGERWDRQGEPYRGDQRHFCRRLQEQLEAADLSLQAGFELEWLVAEAQADGSPRPVLAGGPYGADRLVDGLDYASAVLDAMEAAGLTWLQFHPEYGSSQFELSLAPGSPLQAADRLVLARLLIQRVSQRFGWRCSFSPKPRLDHVGNGGHLHISARHGGVPLLQGGNGPAGLQPMGGQLLAALLEQLPALMALACPQAVSYLRLVPGSWSAPFQVWGVENREAALRLIPTASDGADAHLELKVADLTANPYLLLGAVQAVVLQGLEQPRPLPPPVGGDPGRLPPGQVPRLPSSLEEASRAFGASALLRDAMGDTLHGSLLDSQAAELRRCGQLTPEAIVAASCWWPLVGGLT